MLPGKTIIEKRRETRETQIAGRLNLYGTGQSAIETGVGFFDHMLEAFAKHAWIDLEITCKGDLHIDAHHTVEDVGIVLGQMLGEAIYPVQNVERYGNGIVVMDEAAVQCDLDLSHRGYLVFEMPIEGLLGTFDVELVEEFFRAVSTSVPLTMHMITLRGRNKHHIVEAAFKAFAVALRQAVTPNERAGVPSTKGVL